METLYKNGTILTMEETNQVVEAMVVKNDKIVAVGKLCE